MSEKVNVSITATDGASSVFAKVASAADKLETNLTNAEKAAGRFSRTGAAIGAALGAISGIMADSARAAAEAEISQERLRTAIEATGDSYEMYADQLEAAGEAAVQMGFDDEEAADSIARLTASTGDAGEAIEQLGLIMDIARGRGISLADATRIVEAAELGRIGTLARLGIVLDANASKEEALAELQRRYAGQAEAYANTTAGFYDRVRNQLENVQEALGEHAGAIQSVMVLLPGLSAGWTLASSALGGLITAFGGSTSAGQALLSVLTRVGGWRAGVAIGVTAAIADGLIIAKGAGEDTQKIWEDFANGLPSIGQDINAMTAGAGDDLRLLGDDAIEAFTRISTAATSVEQAWEDGKKPFPDYLNLLGNAEVAALEVGDALFAFNEIMSHTGPGAAAAQEQLAELFAEFNDPQGPQMSAVQLFDSIQGIATELDNLDASAVEEVGSAFRGTAVAAHEAERTLADFLQRVLEIRRGQLVEQFNEVTAAYTNTTNALSAGFRIIVGNTNAVGQQAQAVADWSEQLGLSNNIAEDNARIQQAILDIQVQQAPIIEGLIAAQADYWEGLADAPADQQRLALAYQDTATAAQALSIAQAAAANAPGLENLIAGAMAANPLLQDILEDMGIISVGADGTVTINTEGESELTNLVSMMQKLIATEWIAMFGGDVTAAEAAYEEVMGDAKAWDELVSVGEFDGDNAAAIESVREAETMAREWDGSTSTAKIDADNKSAVTDIGEAQADANNYQKAYTATLNAQDNASGTIRGVAASLAALNGSVATTYINIVEQKIGGAALGGVLGYATGGVVARMGEWGTETLHYPNGGVAYTSGDGLYGVPRGTLVTPHTGLERPGTNIALTVNIANANNTEQIVREIVPALTRALNVQQQGYAR